MGEISNLPPASTPGKPVESSAPAQAVEPTPIQAPIKPVEPTQLESIGEKLAKSESTFTEPEEFVRKERPWRLLTVVAIALGLIPAAFYSPLNRDDLGRPKTVQQLGEDTWRSVEDLTGDLVRTVKKMITREPGENHALWSWAKDDPFLEKMGIYTKSITANGEHHANFTNEINKLRSYKYLQYLLRSCEGSERADLIEFLEQPENKKLCPTLASLDIPEEGGIEDYIPWQITERYKTTEARRKAFEELEEVMHNLKFGIGINKPKTNEGLN